MLKGTENSLDGVKNARGAAMDERVFSSYDLLLKWTINFLSLLILTGGGKRPQVYCQLQLPTSDMLSRFERVMQIDDESFIEFHTNREKTIRA